MTRKNLKQKFVVFHAKDNIGHNSIEGEYQTQ